MSIAHLDAAYRRSTPVQRARAHRSCFTGSVGHFGEDVGQSCLHLFEDRLGRSLEDLAREMFLIGDREVHNLNIVHVNVFGTTEMPAICPSSRKSHRDRLDTMTHQYTPKEVCY